MQSRPVGDVQVSAVGLGEMPLSIEGRPDERRSLATIHAALDAGVTLIDTANSYHLPPDEAGHGEELVARALAAYGGDTSAVLVATKGGMTRTPDGGWGTDGRPDYLKRCCEESLKRLGVEAIGLYQHHRPDPDVPYAESIGAIRDLLDAGKILRAGISNATPEHIREANEVLGGRLVSVQNRFSPVFRSSEPELALCDSMGLTFLAYSPLGGIGRAADLGTRVARFAEVARSHGVSPQRVALAWMLAKSPVLVPIPGSTRPETVTDSAQAPELALSAAELARLDTA
ncbi:aldo/keto reductase [Streptomyces sp. SBT349]|uniref:aldo/keto reductase n=1 Tax=Streptomyces sp. SBT349 TaxID=1580539 RepID=UPI00066D145E|nr:aldo/keto reductase [Streptomyces sp. SBT349]